MDPLSKGTLVVASSFFDLKFKYHMVYNFLFKRACGAHIIISRTYNTKFHFLVKHMDFGGLSVKGESNENKVRMSECASLHS